MPIVIIGILFLVFFGWGVYRLWIKSPSTKEALKNKLNDQKNRSEVVDLTSEWADDEKVLNKREKKVGKKVDKL